MPFLLDGNPTTSEISDALNYVLSNFNTSYTADPNTGQITGPTGDVQGYLYQYMAIKYADSFDGSVNFSNSPTNRQYFGIRNNADAAESSNPVDYIWTKATGGFGVTKFLWFICTGGRQIQFAVATAAPDAGWLIDPGASIDLDVVTSGNIPVIAETFFSYFTPATMQVPRSGNPLSPVFTNVNPVMFSTDGGVVIPFTDAQTDSNVGFVNNSWRIGNSSTTGNGDISYTNITIGNPTDAGDYALWPIPTAMSASPAYINVPVRYKNSLGVVTQASVARLQLVFADPGADGLAGSSIDISGYTSFAQNPGGAFTPTTATLSAILVNVTSPTYAWVISGATPTTGSTASIVVTPTSVSTGVTVTLTVNGSNLLSPISKTVTLPVVYDGVPGSAGANGVMSAFPSIYLWTGSSVPPTRPSTTSTYTWNTGAYTAPTLWATQPPTNTTAGNYLWEITIPLNVTATTTTSTLDWTNVAYAIRAIAYNGADGVNGANGTNGTNGAPGAATFVITRTPNDSSAPTNAEVNALLGRNPVAGDICTVNYNAGNNSVVYRYVTTWTLFQTYITGSLIVQNTITSDKLSVTQLSAISANMGTITAGDLSVGSSPALSGTTMTGTGSHLYANGNFAFGNATTNMVFNGTNVFLNGFVSGSNSQFVFQIIKPYFDKLYNFNVSKPTYILYGTSGDIYFIINDANVSAFFMQYQFGLMPVTGAVEMVAGTNYQISVVGTTNFTAYGAASNTVGTFFTATSVGTGTGQVYDYSTLLMAVNRDWRTPCVLYFGDRNASMSTSFTNTQYLSPRTYGYDIVFRYITLSYLNASGNFISPTPGFLQNLNLQGAINFSYAANI
jgi:hypothetical protein